MKKILKNKWVLGSMLLTTVVGGKAISDTVYEEGRPEDVGLKVFKIEGYEDALCTGDAIELMNRENDAEFENFSEAPTLTSADVPETTFRCFKFTVAPLLKYTPHVNVTTVVPEGHGGAWGDEGDTVAACPIGVPMVLNIGGAGSLPASEAETEWADVDPVAFYISTAAGSSNGGAGFEDIVDANGGYETPDLPAIVAALSTSCGVTVPADQDDSIDEISNYVRSNTGAFFPPNMVGDTCNGIALSGELDVSGGKAMKFVVDFDGKLGGGFNQGGDHPGPSCDVAPPRFAFEEIVE